MSSASSYFTGNLQFSGDGKAFEVTQPKGSGSGYPHCPHKGCKIWDEKLSGVYFSAETFYAGKWAFESAQTFC